MQNLINALQAGTTEYRDEGVVVQHPPTATQIRAAKIVSELNNQNIANQAIIMNQQAQIAQSINEIDELKQRLEDALKTISNTSTISTTVDTNPAGVEATQPQGTTVPGPEHLL